LSTLDLQLVCDFANTEIVHFHESRLNRLKKISLSEVLTKKNPYLFKAKNLDAPSDLISAIMDAFLSSSEEELFGQFLEQLAIFVSAQTCGGVKSSARGLDLEFDRDGIRYLVAVKSGPSWGNSSQQARLAQDLASAVKVAKQGQPTRHVQAVLGICYGKARLQEKAGYQRIVGQSFWHFLSGDERLFVDIIAPIGYHAKEHNERFVAQRDSIKIKLASEFGAQFCQEDGLIDWPKLVAFNSENMHA